MNNLTDPNTYFFITDYPNYSIINVKIKHVITTPFPIGSATWSDLLIKTIEDPNLGLFPVPNSIMTNIYVTKL
jgi:hypothetical protein